MDYRHRSPVTAHARELLCRAVVEGGRPPQDYRHRGSSQQKSARGKWNYEFKRSQY